ncbi:MAG: hypothetical protein AB8H86_31085 [Polyangiales bacterium]
MTPKPLRYFVSSALLVGSLSACGGAEHTVNQAPPRDDEARPVVNEAAHPQPNEHPEHTDPETEPEANPEPDVEPETNAAPEPEPEMSVNPVAPEE